MDNSSCLHCNLPRHPPSQYHLLTLSGANIATSFCFIPSLQETFSPRTQAQQFVAVGKRFHAHINTILFPVYIVSSVVAIAFAPGTVRRNILLGGFIGILAQAPITRFWIAPIAVDIKEFSQKEGKDEDGEKLLDKWNKLSVYRMGFSVFGIGAMLAALII
jgi:hypothetical protein